MAFSLDYSCLVVSSYGTTNLDPVLSKKDNMAINVDFLLLLTERMIPGIKTPLIELPEILQECLRHMCDDNQTLDLLTIARNMLYNEMGGITL